MNYEAMLRFRSSRVDWVESQIKELETIPPDQRSPKEARDLSDLSTQKSRLIEEIAFIEAKVAPKRALNVKPVKLPTTKKPLKRAHKKGKNKK